MHLAAALMVKDEAARILVTLQSVQKHVDGFILFDTGSTDDTVELARAFALEHHMPFHLLEGIFEDFSTSRNKMLAFAESQIVADSQTGRYTHALLMDCNDELKLDAGKYGTLKTHLSQQNTLNAGYYVHQNWFIHRGYELNYYNIRIIKLNSGWLYKGVVHEYLNASLPDMATATLNSDIIIFQDRSKDDGKSAARWHKDLILLKKELALHPTDARTQYYLAQTYECLGLSTDAAYAYKVRSENTDGFYEERFNSLLKCAGYETDENKKIVLYLTAFEVVARAEPLVELSRLYRVKGQNLLAYTFANLACDLSYPHHCTLFVNDKCYQHDRWQEAGISSYYVGEFDKGRQACMKAIESGFDTELNKKNLEYYLLHEKMDPRQ